MSIIRKKLKKGMAYRVRVWREGKRHSKTFTRMYDAQQYEREMQLSATPDEMRFTFHQAAQEWLMRHAETHKAPTSLKTDRQMLRDYLLAAFGHLALRDVSPRQIEGLILDLMRKGLSRSTVNRNLELARAIFNFGIKRGWAVSNPVSIVGLLKTQVPPVVFWTQEEALCFLTHVEAKYEGSGRLAIPRLFRFAMNTGMRMGEILGLGWHEVDLQNRLITVRRAYCGTQRQVKETTKGWKIRHVPINSAIHDMLREMKVKRKEELVFTITGKPLDGANVTHEFQQNAVEAGVRKIRFHDLRHTYASHFMMNGGNIFHLKEILGHSDIKTTQRYAHLSKSFLVDKADTVCFRTDNVMQASFGRDAVNV